MSSSGGRQLAGANQSTRGGPSAFLRMPLGASLLATASSTDLDTTAKGAFPAPDAQPGRHADRHAHAHVCTHTCTRPDSQVTRHKSATFQMPHGATVYLVLRQSDSAPSWRTRVCNSVPLAAGCFSAQDLASCTGSTRPSNRCSLCIWSPRNWPEPNDRIRCHTRTRRGTNDHGRRPRASR